MSDGNPNGDFGRTLVAGAARNSARGRKLSPYQARAQWIAGLLSGEFKQCQERLCELNSYFGPRHCPLGVACEVMRREEGADALPVREMRGTRKTPGYIIFGENSYVSGCWAPAELLEWLDMSNEIGGFEGGSIIELNDVLALSFDKIAAVIKTEPKGLFVA